MSEKFFLHESRDAAAFDVHSYSFIIEQHLLFANGKSGLVGGKGWAGKPAKWMEKCNINCSRNCFLFAVEGGIPVFYIPSYPF